MTDPFPEPEPEAEREPPPPRKKPRKRSRRKRRARAAEPAAKVRTARRPRPQWPRLPREALEAWEARREEVLRFIREKRPFSVAALFLLRVTTIVTLPFVLLVRGSVFTYERYGAPWWIALAVAAAGVLVVLTFYGAWVSHRLSGQARVGMVVKWIALPMVVCYCGYALLYASRAHAKNDAIQSVYSSAHPLLKVALSTLILADRGLVITDLARERSDYPRMRLSPTETSLHYVQADGWVHAVDLRTAGRGSFANTLRQLYFEAMGFETIRHVGTADHLHVALPVR
jgi:hypothetical protein